MTLQRIIDEEDPSMRLDYELDEDEDEDEDDGAGPEPWALGDDDVALFDLPVEDEGPGAADAWLDEQLGRDRPAASADDEPPGRAESPAGDLVLRRPAPTRPRRRRADPDAAADLPPAAVAGYVRDRRGTWRYADGGGAVPCARDLTLRSLHRFPTHHGHIQVPVDLVRSEAELGWCLAWKHTLTTRLAGRRSVTVVRVPVAEWERRADIPFGLWAPELAADRLLGIGDVARLAGVSAATITAYLSRRRMPQPVTRVGHTPLWSRPVIRQWLATRPGQGRRTPRQARRVSGTAPGPLSPAVTSTVGEGRTGAMG